jgi:hypothetical protein
VVDDAFRSRDAVVGNVDKVGVFHCHSVIVIVVIVNRNRSTRPGTNHNRDVNNAMAVLLIGRPFVFDGRYFDESSADADLVLDA